MVDWIELPHWPVFNVADSCIVCGGILAVLLAARGVPLDGRRPQAAGPGGTGGQGDPGGQADRGDQGDQAGDRGGQDGDRGGQDGDRGGQGDQGDRAEKTGTP